MFSSNLNHLFKNAAPCGAQKVDRATLKGHANKDFRSMYKNITQSRKGGEISNPYGTTPLLRRGSARTQKAQVSCPSVLRSSKHQVFNYNYKNNTPWRVSNLYTLLEYAFRSMNSLISKPVLSITPEKIIIQLFFFAINAQSGAVKHVPAEAASPNRAVSLDVKYVFRPKAPEGFIKKNIKKLENLCALLSHYLKKPVELDLVKLYYPFLEPNILALTIASMANDVKLRFIFKNIFKSTIINNSNSMVQRKRFSFLPAGGALTGLNIKVAGRLKTQRVVPRKTVKLLEKGSLSRTNAILVQNARFTNKNKRGSFSISVSLGYTGKGNA